MGKIAILGPDLVDRIAAGEVVERPASVVKELVENSLDAGARRIRVEVAGPGHDIAVQDDGEGMEPDDARLCFARHATSKLSSAEQLHGGISTLGFRGEALAAIAAVSDVELTTRPPHAPAGFRVRVRGGTALEWGPVGCPPGTRVQVRDLFFNTPARRRFLRQPPAERRACLEMAARLALSRPEVAFEMRLDGRLRWSTPGDGSARSVLACLVGPELAERMLEVHHHEGTVAVQGLVSPPGEHRPTRSTLWCFVNGRWVEDRLLSLAACRAYESALPPGRFPVAALYVTVEPAWVDVNVHPTKVQVRFRDERRVFACLVQAVRAALVRQARPVELSGTAGRLQPGAPWGAGQAEPPPQEPVQAGPWTATAAVGEPRAAYGPQAARGGFDSPAALPLPAAEGPVTAPPMPLFGEAPRVLGQLAATYILAEWQGSLLVVDQHVAHERLLFERFQQARRQGRPAPSQPLLSPVQVRVSTLASHVLEELREWLAGAGLELEVFGPGTWLVRRLPLEAAVPVQPERLAGWLEELAMVLAEQGA
ncbi:MAG TPA: DNA mismatch repair endonuclease MutL, partial [Limnochordales bacterium]